MERWNIILADMSVSMEQLKQLTAKVVGELNKDKEPVEDLKTVVGILERVLKGDLVFMEPKTTSYFYDDFLGGISKAALHCFHLKNKEVAFNPTPIDDLQRLCPLPWHDSSLHPRNPSRQRRLH